MKSKEFSEEVVFHCWWCIIIIVLYLACTSCNVHKGMVRCPDNQEISRTKRHKMVKCPKNQKVPRTVWLFNWQIK